MLPTLASRFAESDSYVEMILDIPERPDVPRFREDGAFAGFVGTLVDFTNQYKAIAEVQKHARCASAIAKAAGLTYLLLDPQGKIEQMNSIGEPTAGTNPPVVGSLIWETSVAARHGANAVRGAIERAASTRAIVDLRTLGALKGETEELSWTITPISSASNELIALVATISERVGQALSPVRASEAPRPPAAQTDR